MSGGGDTVHAGDGAVRADDEAPGPAGATVRQVLLQAARHLGSAAEARWVLEHALGPGANAVVAARSDTTMDPASVAVVDDIVARRRAGEPLQYLLGTWAFRRLELAVDPRVLIPRPETEVVAGYALDELTRVSAEASVRADADARADRTEPLVVADLGTGSGALALTLAAEGPDRVGGRPLEVWATDASADALAVARANAAAADLPVRFAGGSWFDALAPDLSGRLALVVSNPPYVSEAEWRDLDPVVRDHEPKGALVAGPWGTEAIDHLLEQGPRWLRPGGAMVLEIAPHQADDVALRALVAGFDAVLVRRDLSGRTRAVVARRW